MTSSSPTILWLRRDLRLADHPGWHAALDAGGPVLPVFILDPVQERALGAAPRWRLGESLRSLSAAIEAQGSRLVLRRGDALDVLRDLARETGKTIELSTHGETTEVDKTVIERLADPMVHLIRNACDHGLETPLAQARCA